MFRHLRGYDQDNYILSASYVWLHGVLQFAFYTEKIVYKVNNKLT